MTESRTVPAAGPFSAAARHMTSWLALAALMSWGSMLAHNLYELPISPLAPENTGPLAVALLLLAARLVWPASRVLLIALFGWGVLNLIGGGIISVLPLPFLPFAPEQSLSHYLVHVVYSLGQVPLLVLTSMVLVRTGRPVRPVTGAVESAAVPNEA
jgi:hypothetical protein